MRSAIASVFEARANLASTLRDARSVVGRLRALLAAIAHGASLLLYLAVWDVNVTRLWVTASSALLSFVFVFGNSMRGGWRGGAGREGAGGARARARPPLSPSRPFSPFPPLLSP